MIRFILLVVLLSSPVQAENNRPNVPSQGEPVVGTYGLVGDTYYVNPDQAVLYVGPVGFDTIVAAGKILTLVGGSKPIQLIINSPGGIVQAGETVIDLLEMARRSGTEVECLVVGAAYSMGFNVLRACNRIYALPSATFLFHPVKTSIEEPMRAIDALQIAQEVDKMDQKYLKVAQRITGLGVEVVRNNYYNETMWTVPMLKAAGCRFFTEVAVIRGLPQSAIQYPGRAEYERTKKDKKKSNANPDWSTIEFINTRHPSGYQVDFSTKTSPASPYSK